MIVNTDVDVLLALQFINDNEVLAYDTETTGLNFFKDIVIGFGISNASSGVYIPCHRWDANSSQLVPCGPSPANINRILEALAAKKLIMFNASFDARMTLNSLKVDLLPALDTDVLLLKHTCDEDFPLDLKGIAAKLFGTEVKLEKEEMQASIREAGGTATQYYKASLETLAKYCVQDCKLTWRIYQHYLPDLRRQGLQEFFYEKEVMPLYKEVVIPMEIAGVELDIPKLRQLQREITKDIAEVQCSIQAAIAPHLTLFTEWFLKKDYPAYTRTGKLSAWTKKYKNAADAFQADNPGQFMFNLHSKHHLKKLFFDTLSEEPLSRTPTGQPQVNEDFLDAMGAKYAWAADLIVYNKLCKLKGTYIDRLLEESHGTRYYPSFAMHRTVSGRLAGDMQQLPRPVNPGSVHPLVEKYTNVIREFVIAPSGSALISADYEQLEPTIFAHVSNDRALQNIFHQGLDFYSEIAIRTLKLQGLSANKKAPNYLATANKELRQQAKAYSLGIAYGMTGYKLQFEINVSESEANQLVQDYLAAFPALARWMHETHDTALRTGVIRSQFGRIRHMGRAKQIFAKYGSRILNGLELWKHMHENPIAYDLAKQEAKELKNYINNAYNFQIQSLAASIMNRNSIAIVRELRRLGLRSKLIMQVHDEMVFEAPQDEVQQLCSIVQRIMQENIKLSVPLRTYPEIGQNFRECKK